MNRSRLVGAVLAALAMMAIGAGPAQATSFTAAEYGALIYGEQNSANGVMFGFEDSNTASCNALGFAGELAAASENLTLAVGSSGCTAFGFNGAVTFNGCDFVLRPGSGSEDNFAGTFDISCPIGEEIVVTGGNCEIQIGSQNGLGPVNYSVLTAPNPDEVEATFAMTAMAGFTYQKTRDGILCPLTGLGTRINGTLTGATTFEAADENTMAQIDFGIE